MFDLEPDHTSEHPRVRRLNMPYRQHPTYWEFTSDSPITDVAEDLLGPDVKVHHSKLNFKWSDGGEEVKMASRHSLLSAYKLRCARDRPLSRRRRR